MPADPVAAKSLFLELAAIGDLVDRAARLRERCGADAELLARVEALLAANDRAAAGAGTASFPGPGEDPDARTANFPDNDEHAGAVIAGRYKLLQQIGEGGMGSVWMADQTEPVKRRVAVKLIRVERGQSKTILSRFEAERQAIAVMDHPHIAKLLDAGTTDTGSPFFVMELIKGVPLNEYCDAHKLSIPDRLHLFLQICSAVQHAHQKGVIHRDLKPSNILVEAHDGKPVPKVIDFGLAKATTGLQLTEHTLFTAFGSVMGTPLYMAPEQAGFNAVDVDTRADIYALGVILYELLTGTTPLTREAIKKAALDEMLKMIREQEAPTPSSRLSTSDSKPSVAANRQTEPLKLGRFVKGELDWIVMKALSKERDRRYETANGFAKDVERFLAHEPVLAGPPGARYRVRKFVQRNRGRVTAAGLVFLALLVGIAGTTWGLIRTEAARRDAVAAAEREAAERLKTEAAKVEAQAKEAEANAVVQFFQNKVFAAARPKGVRGGLGDVSLRDAIAASLPALAKGFADQPVVEARLRQSLGVTFDHLGDAKSAAEQFERAWAIYAERYSPDHPYALRMKSSLAKCYSDLGRYLDAHRLITEVVAAQERLHPPGHLETLHSMCNLAVSFASLGRHAEAFKLREEVLAAYKRVLPPDHPDILLSMSNLAFSYEILGRHPDALKLREEVLAAYKRVLPPDHPDTLKGMTDLSKSHANLGRPLDALKLREEALAAYKRVLGPDHPDTLESMALLAHCYFDLGRHADALKLNEEALAKCRRVLPADHPETLKCMYNQAIYYSRKGRRDDALKLNEEALAGRKRSLPPDHLDTLWSMHNLAGGYYAVGRYADALRLREEVLAARRRVLGPDHPDTLWGMWGLAETLLKLDRGAEALPIIDECLAGAAGKVVNPGIIPGVLLVRTRHFQGTNDAAGCRATAEIWEKRNPTGGDGLYNYNAACLRAVAAGVYAKVKQPGEAAADADRAIVWLTKAVAAGWKDVAHTKTDTDLEFLRGRADFRKLFADLEAKSPPPK